MDAAGTDWSRKVHIERSGQQKSVGHQRIGCVKRGIVEHLEIDRAMRRSARVKGAFVDVEGDAGTALAGDRQFRPEQMVDRRRSVEVFQGSPMQLRTRDWHATFVQQLALGSVTVDDVG